MLIDVLLLVQLCLIGLALGRFVGWCVCRAYYEMTGHWIWKSLD